MIEFQTKDGKTKLIDQLVKTYLDEQQKANVVFVISRLAGKNVARVISARDMTKKEKSYYLKK